MSLSKVLAHSAIALGLCVTACSAGTPTTGIPSEDAGDEGTGQTDPDASSADDAAPDVSTAPPLACGQTVTGSLIYVSSSALGNLPTPTGGTVADGHYVLTDAVVMSSGTFPKMASDLWIRDGRYEYETKNADGWSYSYGGKVTFSGSKMTTTIDCGGQSNPLSWSYSASGTKLTTQFTNINGFSWLYTFKRVN